MGKIVNNSVRTISVGGITLDMNSNTKILSASSNATYDTFRYNAFLYQVPAGKKLIIRAVRVQTLAASNAIMQIGYGDTSVQNSGTGPTGLAFCAFGGGVNTFCETSSTTGSMSEQAIYFEIPAGKFPCIQSAQNVSVIIIAEEV